MPPIFRQVFLCLFLALTTVSLKANANWDFNPNDDLKIHDSAAELASQVYALPDPLFMTPSDTKRVDQLLGRVLNELAIQTKQFDEHLVSYRSDASKEHWVAAQKSYLTLNSLSQSKQQLLTLTSNELRNQLTGFGPYGVRQFQHEWQLTTLNLEYLVHYQLQSFKSLFNDILVSPIPVIWVGLKVLMIYFALVWWLANSQRLITLFKERQLDNNPNPPIWIRAIWYVSRANKAIAWLFAITLSLRVLTQIESLSHLIFLEIFTWWILGGSIAVSFILEFTYRHSVRSSKKLTALRLSTIRRFVWSFIVAGVILQISARTVGEATIYSWIYSVVVLWFALIFISVLRLWRQKVFESVEDIDDKLALLIGRYRISGLS